VLKLLLLIGLVVAVWYGVRWFQRVQRAVEWQERQREVQRRGGGAAAPAPQEAEDMRACPVCGTYVPASGATRCGRANCPYP
jgi:uncharacterized protein